MRFVFLNVSMSAKCYNCDEWRWFVYFMLDPLVHWTTLGYLSRNSSPSAMQFGKPPSRSRRCLRRVIAFSSWFAGIQRKPCIAALHGRVIMGGCGWNSTATNWPSGDMRPDPHPVTLWHVHDKIVCIGLRQNIKYGNCIQPCGAAEYKWLKKL